MELIAIHIVYKVQWRVPLQRPSYRSSGVFTQTGIKCLYPWVKYCAFPWVFLHTLSFLTELFCYVNSGAACTRWNCSDESPVSHVSMCMCVSCAEVQFADMWRFSEVQNRHVLLSCKSEILSPSSANSWRRCYAPCLSFLKDGVDPPLVPSFSLHGCCSHYTSQYHQFVLLFQCNNLEDTGAILFWVYARNCCQN